MGIAIIPGAMALMRIPSLPYSAAVFLVNVMTPLRNVINTVFNPDLRKDAAHGGVLMMLPFFCFSMTGRRPGYRGIPLRLTAMILSRSPLWFHAPGISYEETGVIKQDVDGAHFNTVSLTIPSTSAVTDTSAFIASVR